MGVRDAEVVCVCVSHMRDGSGSWVYYSGALVVDLGWFGLYVCILQLSCMSQLALVDTRCLMNTRSKKTTTMPKNTIMM